MKHVVLTDLGHGEPLVLGQILVEDTRMRSLLNPESTVVRLTSGQSAKSLLSQKGQKLVTKRNCVENAAQQTF